MELGPLLLALDTGSPAVSLALGSGPDRLASRTIEQARSSERLLPLVEEVLAELGAGVKDLTGLVALSGPGSFTGLRVGLATAYGLHQALGIPAVALPTLDVILAAGEGRPGWVVAAVDAIRGEWFVAESAAEARAPRLLKTAELLNLAPATILGFGVGKALAALGSLPEGLATREPPPLAEIALRRALAHPPVWDAAALTRPLYGRAPAVTISPRARPA